MKPYLSVLCLLGLVLGSCSTKYGTQPGGGGGSVSTNSNGPEIEALIARNPGGISVQVIIDDTTSGPILNAAVTMTDPNGTPVPVSYSYSSGQVAYYVGPTTGWSFLPGQTYNVSISYGGTTYSGSANAVGGISFSTVSNGVSCVWSGGGNYNTILLLGPSVTDKEYGPNVNSGYVVPFTDFQDASGSTYSIEVNCENLKVPGFNNASPAAYIDISDQNTDSVVH